MEILQEQEKEKKKEKHSAAQPHPRKRNRSALRHPYREFTRLRIRMAKGMEAKQKKVELHNFLTRYLEAEEEWKKEATRLVREYLGVTE